MLGIRHPNPIAGPSPFMRFKIVVRALNNLSFPPQDKLQRDKGIDQSVSFDSVGSASSDFHLEKCKIPPIRIFRERHWGPSGRLCRRRRNRPSGAPPRPPRGFADHRLFPRRRERDDVRRPGTSHDRIETARPCVERRALFVRPRVALIYSDDAGPASRYVI
jgi:hypothetical protein